MQIKRGFTLIELLVTIAIVAIIATFAINSYTNYRIRAKFAALVAVAGPAKFAVQSDYFNQGYTFTNSNYASGTTPFVTASSDLISSIAVTNGVITITGNSSSLGGRAIVIQFTPTVTNNSITWTCATSSSFFQYAPLDCQNAL